MVGSIPNQKPSNYSVAAFVFATDPRWGLKIYPFLTVGNFLHQL